MHQAHFQASTLFVCFRSIYPCNSLSSKIWQVICLHRYLMICLVIDCEKPYFFQENFIIFRLNFCLSSKLYSDVFSAIGFINHLFCCHCRYFFSVNIVAYLRYFQQPVSESKSTNHPSVNEIRFQMNFVECVQTIVMLNRPSYTGFTMRDLDQMVNGVFLFNVLKNDTVIMSIHYSRTQIVSVMKSGLMICLKI